MRLTWSDRALDDLRDIHERAPVQARNIVLAVDTLVGSPFPWMYRRVEDRPGEHVRVVQPHAVFYAIEGDTLTVLRLEDGRRLTTLP